MKGVIMNEKCKNCEETIDVRGVHVEQEVIPLCFKHRYSYFKSLIKDMNEAKKYLDNRPNNLDESTIKILKRNEYLVWEIIRELDRKNSEEK